MQSADLVYGVGHYSIAVSANVFSLYDLEPFFAGAIEEPFGQTRGSAELRLDISDGAGLELQWYKFEHDKPLRFHLDFVKQLRSLRSFPAPKQGAFNQALGKKTQTILDATGGWGGDAMLMATQGYRVNILERSPVMALLLKDAFARLGDFVSRSESPIRLPSVEFSDSIKAMGERCATVDCVYLDPMFPAKRKKSASANKQMQLLQWMVGEDRDAANLLQAALVGGAKRVAVKRPDYAIPLLRAPDQRFSSKLVHYDVYLSN